MNFLKKTIEIRNNLLKIWKWSGEINNILLEMKHSNKKAMDLRNNETNGIRKVALKEK